MGKNRNLLVKGLVALSLIAPHLASAQVNPVKRPPQFVLLAFDGSYNNDVWEYSRNFTKTKKQQGTDVRFTFFINPSYLLTEDSSSNRHYHAPHKSRPGTSNIGWGDNNKDVGLRVDQMNEAFREGHEIASHTVGHYNGSQWSADQWTSEFRQFDDILLNFFRYNNMGPSPMGYNRLLFTKDIVGFRAPQLGYNNALYSIMPSFGFSYDTSKATTDETYWPRKNRGLWNFPLAQVKEPGGGRRWISMDYNFCFRDSARILSESPETLKLTLKKANGKVVKNGDKSCLNVITDNQKKEVKNNMMNIYRAYFNMNYYGNRAPIHIGHHFSSWMKGAYLEAFFQFANEVCSKPEVKCVTYAELQQFMDNQQKSQIDALQAGKFSDGKFPRPKSATMPRHLDLTIKPEAKEDALVFALEGKDANLKGLTRFITVGDKTREFDGTLNLKDLRNEVGSNEDAIVRVAIKDRLKKEIATGSYQFEKMGTVEEKINLNNLEDEWIKGDMPGAHKDEYNR